jgi:hypothetical protein
MRVCSSVCVCDDCDIRYATLTRQHQQCDPSGKSKESERALSEMKDLQKELKEQLANIATSGGGKADSAEVCLAISMHVCVYVCMCMCVCMCVCVCVCV